MFVIRLLVVVLTLLSAASASHLCNCSYEPGGCFINKAAPPGFKCKCRYLGGWTCNGVAYPCEDHEACPGGRYSYCACVQGGGDCDAYYLRPTTKDRCSEVNKVESTSSLRQSPSFEDCDCSWFSGGCIIITPAPEGFKCVCSYKGFWTCQGWSQGCDEDEYCPGGEYTYCGCKQGQGDCGAYPDSVKKKGCNFSKPEAKTCDCDRSSDWHKGSYSIDDVTFKTKDIVKSNPMPVQIGAALDVPNASGVTQSQTMKVAKTLSSESVFERTHGFSVEIGVEFSTTIPFGEITSTTTISTSNTFTYGETTTISTEFSHAFTCTSPPRELTRCKVFLTSYDVAVPYTMLLKHNEIPDCVCNSYGNWKGVASYNSRLSAETIGPCNGVNSEGTCV